MKLIRKTRDGRRRTVWLLGFRLFSYGRDKKGHVSVPPGNVVEGVPRGCRVVIYGSANSVVFHEPVARIFDGRICIGSPDCPVNGCTVDIGADCTSNGVDIRLMEDGSRLEFGRDCMLSEGVKIWVSDTHAITDGEGRLVNEGRFVSLGDHVWLGHGASVLKNSRIPAGTVVGAGAVFVGSRLKEENCVVAGNPAIVVKRGVVWHRERPKQWMSKMDVRE